MPEINLREFRSLVEDTLRRYLFTLNFLPDSERELRDAFRSALRGRRVLLSRTASERIPSYRPAPPPQISWDELKLRGYIRAFARLSNGGFDRDAPSMITSSEPGPCTATANVLLPLDR